MLAICVHRRFLRRLARQTRKIRFTKVFIIMQPWTKNQGPVAANQRRAQMNRWQPLSTVWEYCMAMSRKIMTA